MSVSLSEVVVIHDESLSNNGKRQDIPIMEAVLEGTISRSDVELTLRGFDTSDAIEVYTIASVKAVICPSVDSEDIDDSKISGSC